MEGLKVLHVAWSLAGDTLLTRYVINVKPDEGYKAHCTANDGACVRVSASARAVGVFFCHHERTYKPPRRKTALRAAFCGMLICTLEMNAIGRKSKITSKTTSGTDCP